MSRSFGQLGKATAQTQYTDLFSSRYLNVEVFQKMDVIVRHIKYLKTDSTNDNMEDLLKRLTISVLLQVRHLEKTSQFSMFLHKRNNVFNRMSRLGSL